MAAQSVRDGLIIDEVDSILPVLMQQLSAFAASGADFAVHTGDTVCGGSTFGLTPAEFTQSLHHYRALEVSALGSWPVLHIPGNHDLDPNPQRGGTRAWRQAMCANTTRPLSRLACSAGSPNYRSIRAAGWRIVLLDAQDGLGRDSDGHGRIGAAQLEWLRGELEDAALTSEQVILVMHQLLVDPSSGQPTSGSAMDGHPSGAPPPAGSWVEGMQDFVSNRAEVLSLLFKFNHVRLSLHGHVHANSVVTRHGVRFVTTASAIEFPMHWREVEVHQCELRLTTHAVNVPRQRDRSRQADRREGRNDLKLGSADANSVVIRTCDLA
jgi:3',5'-cyclic AMP phosphodiesterase CpdA